MLFCPQFIPQNAGNHILGPKNFKILGGSMPLDPPRKRGLMVEIFFTQTNILKMHFKACLHGGGGLQVGEVSHLSI